MTSLSSVPTLAGETSEKIQMLNQHAWLERNKDVQKSFQMAQEAQKLIVENAQNNNQELVKSLRTQSYCLEHLSRYSEAMTTAIQAMEQANLSDDRRMIASLYNILGNIYWRLDDYSAAINHYLSGLKMLQAEPDREVEIFLVQGLGIVHYAMGNYQEAITYFKLSIDTAAPDDIMGRAMGYNNVAFALHKMNQDKEALSYAIEAQALFEQDHFSVGKLECLHTLGSIYLRLGDTERAFDYFQHGVQDSEQCQNLLQKINALLGMCKVHQERGELQTALEKLQLAITIAEEIGSLASQAETHTLLSAINKQLGNYQAALEHFEKFYAIHVKLYDEQSDRRIRNAQIVHEVDTIRKQADLYRQLATTDSLTGMINRRAFFELANKLMAQAFTEQKPASILMIDLDQFKPVNDQYGHTIGDQVLTIIAKRLKHALRESDLAGRYGGDEFVILLPNTDETHCCDVAERCRKVVCETPIELGTLLLSVSISIGASTLSPSEHVRLEAFIDSADQALLAAKKRGRNCTVSTFCGKSSSMAVG